MNEQLQRMMEELRKPFHPSRVTWKPGAIKGDRALALAYADVRVYMDRLDEVCGADWSVTYEPWGADRIICRLTIAGVTRSSTGESTNESERSEIGGTVAEAQAFKRAGAMFGLGRYLYTLPTTWADYDPHTKQFTDKAKAKLTQILVQHYRRATAGEETAEGDTRVEASMPAQEPAAVRADPPATAGTSGRKRSASKNRAGWELLKELHELGSKLYGDGWDAKRTILLQSISKGAAKTTGNLTVQEAETLIQGIKAKLAEQRQGVAA